MFYLTAFLSMLIGLLIYMMDPAPTDLRRDMDNRTGEAYIGAFLNQHQAARDFVKHWLGYINPDDSNVVQAYGSTKSNEVQAIAIPGGLQGVNIARPVIGLEYFMPRGLVIERYTDRNNPNKGFLRKDAGNPVGSYMSALICLDNSGNLTACYTDGEYLSGSDIIKSSEIRDGYANSNARRLKYQEGENPVKPYVITYSNGDDQPAWWDDKDKSPRAIRLQLWRRAMAKRSHSSHRCGVLYKAPDVGTLLGDGRESSGGWVYSTGNRYNRVRVGIRGEDAADLPEYCLDNGQRCMSVLPVGVQEFLSWAICDNPTCDLSETFFCISPVEDPYERIATSTYHFDGFNSQGMGAQKGIGSNEQFWVPTVGPIVTTPGETIFDKLAHYVDETTLNISTGASLANTGFGIRLNEGKILQMPFHYQTGAFTLIFVIDIASSDDNGWIIGHGPEGTENLDEGVFFGLRRPSGSDDLVFYPRSGVTVTMRDAAGPVAAVISDGSVTPITTRHVMAIMRNDANEMFFFLDGKYYCNVVDDVDHNPIDWSGAISALGTGTNITFGPDSQVSVLDVRYYNRALSGRELQGLFKVDMARYGVVKTLTTGNGLCDEIPEGNVVHYAAPAP